VRGTGLFAARYSGRCGSCDEPFDVGDRVAFLTTGELVCVSCLLSDEQPPTSKREPPPCPTCWLVHPGSCEDARA
jgi:hypothetical protein